MTRFEILQNIYVHDVALSNKRALDALNRGAESIRFTIENENVVLTDLMQNLPLENTSYFFYLSFLFSKQFHLHVLIKSEECIEIR